MRISPPRAAINTSVFQKPREFSTLRDVVLATLPRDGSAIRAVDLFKLLSQAQQKGEIHYPHTIKYGRVYEILSSDDPAIKFRGRGLFSLYLPNQFGRVSLRIDRTG